MKKLHLNRETVRKLKENQLVKVQGASGAGHSCNPGVCYEVPTQTVPERHVSRDGPVSAPDPRLLSGTEQKGAGSA